MKNKDLISFFCTRVCHDMLGAVGALQIAIDNLEINTEDSKYIESAMKSIILYFDLLRKTFGYQSEILDQNKILSMSDEIFGKKLIIKNNLHISWCNYVLQLFIWLKYKVIEKSTIVLSSSENQLTFEMKNIILTDEEIALLNGKPGITNTYLIYLTLLMENLDDNIKLSLTKTDENCFELKLYVE